MFKLQGISYEKKNRFNEHSRLSLVECKCDVPKIQKKKKKGIELVAERGRKKKTLAVGNINWMP